MSLHVLVGGARSGKSGLAVEMGTKWAGRVVVIVTAEARDDEMTERINRHRADRPPDWDTVEEPLDLEAALGSVPGDSLALVDCLTLWVSNLLETGVKDPEIEELARRSAVTAAARAADTIVVTNEVGSGIVPANALARRFQDLLGRVNSIWVDASDRTILVVAGRVLPLRSPDVLWSEP
ncbi:MAG: bifunctional adenosylcobinamide kinase/adenosylcobinamide-phosphate guanylyltransferase [Actinobacteria bacterium]|nr:bifunctional adenosylcobinamide kinase/adenosylcobinamide-phosphate guanylyltransferase [Actinomycetota bacterium]